MRRKSVKRSAIPPLLIGALSLWISTAITYGYLFDRSFDAHHLFFGISILILLCGVVSKVLRFPSLVSLIFIFLSMGGMLGTSAAIQETLKLSSIPTESRTWDVELEQDMTPAGSSSMAIATIEDESGLHMRVTVFSKTHEGLLCREKLHGSGALRPVKEEYRERSWSQGVCASLDIDAMEVSEPFFLFAPVIETRRNVLRSFQQHGGERAGLLSALVCGHRSEIRSDGTYERFKTCGLAHIIAVSGAHLALVAMILGKLLGRASRLTRIIGCSLFLGIYLVFAGMPLSGIRATIMVILSYGAWIFSRRKASLNACAIAMIAILAIDPISCLSVSLFLSVGSTLGILLFAPLISEWFGSANRNIEGFVIGPFAMTLASNLMTQPYAMALFSQCSLISFLANVLVAPLFVVSCVCGLTGAFLAWAIPWIAPTSIGIAALAVTPLDQLVGLLSHIPHASIPVFFEPSTMVILSSIGALALWYFWPRPSKLLMRSFAIILLVLPVFAHFAPRASMDNDLIMLDVGQGDALVLQSHGVNVLVDTGTSDAQLREALGRLGIWELDAVIITHPDDDHCGSLASLMTYTVVKTVFISEVVLQCPCEKCTSFVAATGSLVGQDNMQALRGNDRLFIGDFTCRVLWPLEMMDGGGNGDSIVLLVETDIDGNGKIEWSMLLTGDAEAEVLENLVERGWIDSIDILKVGHHGSKASLSEEVTRTLSPSIALISVGGSNRYGHPAPNTLEALDDHGSKILRTDQKGMVKLKYNAESMVVVDDDGDHISIMREGSEW